jgi:hypothetical protein
MQGVLDRHDRRSRGVGRRSRRRTTSRRTSLEDGLLVSYVRDVSVMPQVASGARRRAICSDPAGTPHGKSDDR